MSTQKVIGTIDDLEPGQSKQIELDEVKLVLVRLDDQYRAFLGECPHHGAPLGEGALQDGCIWCPWHQSEFDAETGQVISPPALDDLPHFDVDIRGRELVVTLPEETPKAKVPAMAERREGADGRTFVIVGAGAAGAAAAETLRREGFQGRIRMITREAHRPYDRTELSKRWMGDPEAKAPYYREEGFYEDHGVEILYETTVDDLDVDAHRLRTLDGQELSYDRLLLATGGLPRRLDVDGEQLEGVFTLRSFEDAKAISARVDKASKAVLVGASFIAMELAAQFNKRGLDVTVVAPESIPFETVFGGRIGEMYRKVHQDKGVQFRLGNTVKAFGGDNGEIAWAELDDGERVEADLAVVGVGVRPATDFLRRLRLADDGSVKVDLHLRAGEDVYAAGDIARLPNPRADGFMRIEHWVVAQHQGVVAAKNMLDKEVACTDAPFFWTNQHMVICNYAGHAPQWDEVVIDGDVDQQDFLAYYVLDDDVQAVLGCGRNKAINRAMRELGTVDFVSLKRLRSRIEA